MRTECKHYESRTYRSGEVVRKCQLDLAPEAPWRCPEDCPSFALRMMDAGWAYGSLAKGAEPPEPEPEGEDVVALLNAAEDIVNSAAPTILSEFAPKERRGPLGRRKGKKKRK